MLVSDQHVRPLCPAHQHVVMRAIPNAVDWPIPSASGDLIDTHNFECPMEGCQQHYARSFGYFILEENIEHSAATGSPALRIKRNPTQVICAHHKYSMFLNSLQPSTKLGNFRCPHANCQQVLVIATDGPPAFWLSEGHFGSVRF